MMAVPYRTPLLPLTAHTVEVPRTVSVPRLLASGGFELVPVGPRVGFLPEEDPSALSVPAGRFTVALVDADGDEPFHEILAVLAPYGLRPAPVAKAIAFAAAWTRLPDEIPLARLSRAVPMRRAEPALLGWMRDFACEGRIHRGAPCAHAPGPPFASFVDGARRWLILAQASAA